MAIDGGPNIGFEAEVAGVSHDADDREPRPAVAGEEADSLANRVNARKETLSRKRIDEEFRAERCVTIFKQSAGLQRDIHGAEVGRRRRAELYFRRVSGGLLPLDDELTAKVLAE